MKKNIYNLFLNNYTDQFEGNSEEFDYSFNLNSSYNDFNKEFNKFIFLLNNIYYNGEKLVYPINDLNISLKEDVIKQILELHRYTKENNLDVYNMFISEFLYTYYMTMQKNNDQKLKCLRELLIEYIGNDFYKYLKENCSIFYNEIINYIESLDLEDNYISQESIKRMIENSNKETRVFIIESLIKYEKFVLLLSEYDLNLEKNKKYYYDFVIKILKQPDYINDVNSIIKKLIKKEILCKDEIDNIINAYINKINLLIKKYINDNQNMSLFIHEIDYLKNCLNEIKGINNLKSNYKHKIEECITKLFHLKRIILGNKEYVMSSMQEFKSDIMIEKENVNNFCKELLENPLKIYAASKINFDVVLKDSIENKDKFILSYIIPTYNIDTKNQVYSLNNNDDLKHVKNIVDYYDEKGTSIENKNNNKIIGDYFKLMMKEVSKTFFIHQNLIISLLKKDDFRELISKLKQIFLYENNCNDYEIIGRNTITIEYLLYSISNESIDTNIDDVINKLFEKFKDNERIRNGLMYVYYIIYYRDGFNLRNKVFHGTLVGDNLEIALLVSFASLIFINWMASNEQNN